MKIFPEIEGVAFGLVDGVVLVLGLIIGVWAATGNLNTILLAALIGGIANAFGNSAGVFLSQTAERGVQLHEKRRHQVKTKAHSEGEVLRISLFAFASSVLTVFILIVPFYLFGITQAALVSLAVALALLFLLGRHVGKLSEDGATKFGLMYACVGLLAAAIAFLAGEGLKLFLL
jgi:predicted membrane protein (TIGR00267 family)